MIQNENAQIILLVSGGGETEIMCKCMILQHKSKLVEHFMRPSMIHTQDLTAETIL